MMYKAFCEYLERLNKTTKRLEITAILASMIKALDTNEVENALFLSLGYLKPPYSQLKFNMADKMVARSLELCYNMKKPEVETMYSDIGDLGDVVEILSSKTAQTHRGRSEQTINGVHKSLCTMALDEGSGSQDRKVAQLAALLKTLDPVSAKYTVRIVLNTTRLGFTEQTVVDALSNGISGNKSSSRIIEEVYNIHPNVGYIAKMLKEKGLAGLKDITIETEVPVLSQRAQRLSDPEEILEKVGGEGWAEYKLDGTRVQLHLDRDKNILTNKVNQDNLFSPNDSVVMVKTFTRNLEENTYQFPDIVEAALKQIKAASVILDGEAIGYDPKTGKYIPFQDMMQRKRKHNVGDYAKQIPLKYIVFDILYLNGQSLTGLDLKSRHKKLEEVIKVGDTLEVAEHIATTDPTELWQFFEASKEKNLEGIMIKNPSAVYRAGAREFSWIKLKKSNTDLLEDTIDCVVLGYYFGRGSRADFGIGGFLCGVWNNNDQIFTTLTKVGTGLRDEEWVELKSRCDKIRVSKCPKNVLVHKTLQPNVWVEPRIVVELGGDEISVSQNHTSGYALRFPRLLRFRNDKKATDATSQKEIKDLHKSQRSIEK